MQVSMDDYIAKIIDEFSEVVSDSAPSPAIHYLCQIIEKVI